MSCYQFAKDPDKAYVEMKASLKGYFGQDHVIISDLVKECTDGPQLKFKDLAGLKSLAIAMNKCEVTLEELGKTSALKSEEKLEKIYKDRLPNEVRSAWLKKLKHLRSACVLH